MKHFLAVEDFSREELEELIGLAGRFQANPYGNQLRKKTLVTLFFNPSTRTMASFDLAMHQLGGHTICLEPGKSSWGIEVNEGAAMDGESEEHLKDATKVLCRYADALAVRCFPSFKDWDEDKKDLVLRNMARWSDKPVINMETITHPCQALAMMKTIKERVGEPKGKKFVLTWAYHPKPLNNAVANSAGIVASMFGMDVVVANPPGYGLDSSYLCQMKRNCKNNGADFSVVHDMSELKDADFVYAKSWGALSQYGRFQKDVHDLHKDWIVSPDKLGSRTYFSHCLPVRRNVVATDEVIDSERSLVYDEAENRLHVQKAILAKLIGNGTIK
ncbi:MAG: N-acetylornithine carbamoyltransferase [archaeon]